MVSTVGSSLIGAIKVEGKHIAYGERVKGKQDILHHRIMGV
jgi:hypothetical protein